MSNCAPFPLPSLALPGLNLSFNLFSLPTISLGLACPIGEGNCAPFPLPSLALPGLNLSFNLFSLPTISLGLACPLD